MKPSEKAIDRAWHGVMCCVSKEHVEDALKAAYAIDFPEDAPPKTLDQATIDELRQELRYKDEVIYNLAKIAARK